MIALGLLLVLVGFVIVMPSGAMPGSASHRIIPMTTRLFSTPGPDGLPSRRYRVVQVLMGLVIMAGGFVIIAASG